MKKAENGIFTVAVPQAAENVQLPDPSLLNYYKGKEHRLLWILGPVDESLYEIIQDIIEFNYEDKDIEPEKRKPIKLIMASPGGSLEVEQAVTAIIEVSKTPVYCIAIGMCASAASMIYLSGHKRYATKNASFLFHQGGCENLEGTYQQIVAFMEKYQADVEEMSKFYKEHTKFPADVIDENLAEGDWYISIDEACQNGIVDKIVTQLDIFM